MSGFEGVPPEERTDELEDLDLSSLYALREILAKEASGEASRIFLGRELEPIDEEITDPAVREHIIARERVIHAERNIERANDLKRLAQEVDAMIAIKEGEAGLP